jgi:hypothetical protein
VLGAAFVVKHSGEVVDDKDDRLGGKFDGAPDSHAGVRRSDYLVCSFLQGTRCHCERDDSSPHMLPSIDNKADLSQHHGHYIISK